MAYDPLNPNTWNEPAQPAQADNLALSGLVSAQPSLVADELGNTYNPQTQQYTSPAWSDMGVLSLDASGNSPLFNMASGEKLAPEKVIGNKDTMLGNIGASLSEMLKKNGGEIFAKTMMGSAQGVLTFLAQRRTARSQTEQLDRKFQYEKQLTDERLARASAVPQVGTMVKPGVTGQLKVGNQQVPTQQYVGLINAPRI